MTTEFGHADDGFGEDGVELLIEPEQVAAMRDETVEVFGLVEVEAAGEAGEDKAEAEDIGDGIVVADLVFPGNIAGEENRFRDFVVAFADVEVYVFVGTGIDVDGSFVGGEHFDCADRFVEQSQFAGIFRWRFGGCVGVPESDAFDLEDHNAVKRRNFTDSVGLRDLMGKRQKSRQSIFRGTSAEFEA